MQAKHIQTALWIGAALALGGFVFASCDLPQILSPSALAAASAGGCNLCYTQETCSTLCAPSGGKWYICDGSSTAAYCRSTEDEKTCTPNGQDSFSCGDKDECTAAGCNQCDDYGPCTFYRKKSGDSC